MMPEYTFMAVATAAKTPVNGVSAETAPPICDVKVESASPAAARKLLPTPSDTLNALRVLLSTLPSPAQIEGLSAPIGNCVIEKPDELLVVCGWGSAGSPTKPV